MTTALHHGVVADAHIPLDLSCWRPGLRHVADAHIPLDLSCWRPGLRHVADAHISLDLSCWRPGLRHVADALIPLDLSCWRPGLRHVEIDLSGLKHVRDFISVSDLSAACLKRAKTCRKPSFRQVLSKIDLMEFGHKTMNKIIISQCWCR